MKYCPKCNALNENDRYTCIYCKEPFSMPSKTNKKSNDTQNKIAVAIRVISILTYICGFIAGIVFAANQPSYSSLYGSHSNHFSWVVAFIWWGASFISGTFILGFSEIIKLLNDIKMSITSTPNSSR